MRRRDQCLILAAGLVLVLLLVLFLTRSREPRYNGHSLSSWYRMVCRTYGRQTNFQALAAIDAIGTNAIPFLLDRIKYQEPPGRSDTRKFVRRFLGKFKIDPFPPIIDEDTIGTGLCLQSLGSKAAGAVDELSNIVNCATYDMAVYRAATALSMLGQMGFPPLMAALTNQQSRYRSHLISRIGRMGTNALPAVPVLIQCLSNRTEEAMMAARTLGRLGLNPELSIPALIKCVEDSTNPLRGSAIRALGEYGTNARSAIPVLLNALAHEKTWFSNDINKELRTINPAGP